jgi:hypothetical protein
LLQLRGNFFSFGSAARQSSAATQDGHVTNMNKSGRK